MSVAPLFNEMAKAPPGGRAFWRTASDGVRIRIAHWPSLETVPNRGTVLLLPGRTEYIEKYGFTASELAAKGFDILTIDWRGQGLADRPDEDRSLGHVDHFDEYQLDLAQMMDVGETLDLPRPFTLLAHSMGGCIGLRALHNGLDVAGACFSAPMWGIILSKPLRPVAWGFSWALHNGPWKLTLAPGTVRQTYVLAEPFDDNMLTTDRHMWAMMQDQANTHPELTLGGPSAGWLFAALREMRELARMPAPNVPAITWLGTNERIVEPEPIHTLMARWPNGQLNIANGKEHEVLMENPTVRGQIYASIEQLARETSSNSAA